MAAAAAAVATPPAAIRMQPPPSDPLPGLLLTSLPAPCGMHVMHDANVCQIAPVLMQQALPDLHGRKLICQVYIDSARHKDLFDVTSECLYMVAVPFQVSLCCSLGEGF